MSSLFCSVCEEHYYDKNDWLHHLSQDDHQNLARKAFLSEEVKLEQTGRNKNCLVVFTLMPLTSDKACLEVLEYFSKLIDGKWEALPINFIWWMDRPYVGILQFESLAQVKEVLKALEVREGSSTLPKIRIGRRHHQTIHVKAGYQMPMLEWRHHPPPPPINSPPPSRQQASFSDSDSPAKIKEEPKSADDDTIDRHRLFKRLRLSKKPEVPHQDNCFIANDNDNAKPSSSRSSVSTRSLQAEYKVIQELMLILDSKKHQISATLASLQKTLMKLDPHLQVAPFRKACLQMNYPPDLPYNQEDILAHVYTTGDHTAFEVDAKVKDYLNQTKTKFLLVKELQDHLKLFHIPTTLKITLVTPKRKGCLAEVQVCRLMEYLCQFDPRCHSLMTLACYWVTLNEIQIAGEDKIGQRGRALPSQYAIQWLVLFFLSNKQYIPTVREVLELNPVDNLRDDVTGENVGFLSNPGYVEKWTQHQKGTMRSTGQRIRGHGILIGRENREKYILNCLLFFLEFLRVSGRILGKKYPWIFNTMDGVQMSVRNFLEMDLLNKEGWGGGRRWKNMTKEEGERLREVLGENREKLGMKMDCGGIHMTHPFLWGEKICGMEGEELRILVGKFLKGAKKLEEFFERVDKGRRDGDVGNVGKALELVGGLENLLRI